MNTNVLIIGGGLSGLSVAKGLEQYGIDYLLVEARHRFGGRILSTTAKNVSDDPQSRYDLGPSWIWQGQPRVQRLLAELALNVFPQYSTGNLVFEDANGHIQRDLDFSTMADSYRIEGGIVTIIEGLEEKINTEKCLLSHRVTHVEKTEQGHQATLVTPAGEARISAKMVVFCLPPRLVANNITFLPTLPQTAVTSMQHIPTWMAGHAKFVAVYASPFWREMGLSGDAISHRGPLVEIHDATTANGERGALFGFVGVPNGSPLREPEQLKQQAIVQLERLFGAKAASPVDIIFKDWAKEPHTATARDTGSGGHPQYGMTTEIAQLANQGFFFASTEMATQFGGVIEGALEAAENALQWIQGNSH